ncbi:3-oxoacyl-[acyl-carrier-protein] reductase [Butyrivibrio sp. XPD2006]|uniref:3-oxoacyl-[acyl-carrier-protein] reductase n=1 Tax=Butyrivibrio sp. XPD2006 TaxID=1280668 RepID=UPI0003B3CDD6|nr:3-oxoacyl-[acyl-carrier-protein] reductase [Butyrivibrio sp. XPD2006]
MNFYGQVCLITGASRGIGAATAIEFARNGADAVIINYMKSVEAAERIADAVRKCGATAAVIQADISDPAQCKHMVDHVISEFKRIDVLVNNAGINKDNLVMNMSDEDFDHVLSVNLKSCFNTIHCVSKQFIRQKYGRIVNVSSISGLYGHVGQVNYAASKAAIIGLTKSVAKEYATRGITCNAVAPGYIDTDMTGSLNERERGETLSYIAMKRFGRPEEIACAIAFLASKEASYITGEVVEISGGIL